MRIKHLFAALRMSKFCCAVCEFILFATVDVGVVVAAGVGVAVASTEFSTKPTDMLC